jgi:hypothetical protein
MRFVLLVLDTHGSSESERMAFYAELQRHNKWNGWDCLPHTFVARFVLDLAEARGTVEHLDVPDSLLQQRFGFAADDREIRDQVADELRAVARVAQIPRWRARISISDARPSSIAYDD